MTINSNPPIELPIENLTVSQKWALYQTLREELEPGTDDEIPESHLRMLEEREARIERGEAKWLPAEEVIRRLEAKYS
jgi:hypothetical protein